MANRIRTSLMVEPAHAAGQHSTGLTAAAQMRLRRTCFSTPTPTSAANSSTQDLPAVLERARAAGVTRMVAPATDLENARKLLAIAETSRMCGSPLASIPAMRIR
jgi:Tat protein secretion system quality control protein TatD with DNase activity